MLESPSEPKSPKPTSEPKYESPTWKFFIPGEADFIIITQEENETYDEAIIRKLVELGWSPEKITEEMGGVKEISNRLDLE